MKISPPTSENGIEGHYAHNKKCKWIIVAPPTSMVELSFKSFELEHMDSCHYADYVKIYDGIVVDENDDAIKPIGTYCGSDKPPTMLSTSHAFTIVFRSDDTINGEGFEAKFDFIDDQNCEYIQTLRVRCSKIAIKNRPNFQSAVDNSTHCLEQL